MSKKKSGSSKARGRPKEDAPAPPVKRGPGRPRIHPKPMGRPVVEPEQRKISCYICLRRCARDAVDALSAKAGMTAAHWLEKFVVEPFLLAAGVVLPPHPMTKKERARIEAEARKKRSQAAAEAKARKARTPQRTGARG